MPNVLIEDKNMVIQFDDNMSSDEIGNVIRQNVYGEDLTVGVEAPRDRIKEGATSLWKGIQQPILSSPTAAASLTLEFSERFEEEPDKVDLVQAIAGNPHPFIFKKLKSFVGKNTNLDEGAALAAKNVIDMNMDFLRKRKIEPEEGKVNNFLFNLGSGGTTLAVAVGMTALTKSPHSAAALFGAYQKANLYREARGAGLEPKEAGRLSTVGGVVEGSLEYIGLDYMFKGYGSRLFNMAFRGGVEALQEFSQQTGENLIVKLGGVDGARPIFEGAGEAALIGFLLGAPASVAIDMMADTNVKQSLLDKGITEEQTDTILNKINEDVRNAAGEAIAQEASEVDMKIEEIRAKEPTKEAEPLAERELEGEFAPFARPEAVEELPPKVTPQEVKELTITKRLQARLDEIQDFQQKAEFAEEALAEGGKVEEFLKGRVKRFEKGFLAEELASFPKGFFTTKEDAITLDEAIDEINKANLGVTFTSESDLAQFLNAWQSDKTMLKDVIEQGRVAVVKQRETTQIKQRLKDITTGIRQGTIITKKDIKGIQTELIGFLERSDLTAQDKAKFIKTIKNIQTQEQLQKAIPTIEQRISQLEQAQSKRSIESRIKKELKATKPVKVGQKKVGKYDYQSNKLFDELRAFNKLSKTAAFTKLEAYPEADLTEIDLVKRRFLSLKTNGKEASVEIFNRVLADIRRMKQIGETAKNEADFIKLMNRQEKVDQALESIGNIKADKKTIKTKIGNVYRQGFSNPYSMFNSIAGKKFAEEYDPEISENTRDTAVFFKTKEMITEASNIYNNKNVLNLLTRDMSQKIYKITDIDGLTTELTKLDLIDIYNSLKNDKVSERYNNAFGESQVQSLMGELLEADMRFADYLQETVQGYRQILNERNIEITGRDLGFVENYWPATSEFQVSVLDDVRVQGETPSALKERAKSSKVIPVPRNAWLKAQKHIAQAEHVTNLSREFETLKRLFNDRKVKHAIKQKFGDDVYNVLNDQIDNISLNSQSKRIDAVSKWFGFAINNWVTSKIALNPSTYVRQLMSVGNYIENMNAGKWVEDFAKGIRSPKETFNFMWENAPFLEARFNRGYSEAVANAIKGAESLNTNWGSYTKFLSSFARAGDITAIVYGGYPLVQSELAKGKSIKEAIEVFEKSTLKSQQSGLSSSISQFQNSRNPFARLFLAFKNTSNQYFRKMVDAVISRQNGDISVEQFAKTMTIYAIIQPTLYAASGYLLKQGLKELGQLIRGKPEDDEILEGLALSIMTQLIVAPVNAIPVLDDIMTFAARKLTGQKAWKVFSTPLFDELETGFRKLSKKETTAEDYLKATASILVEPGTGTPVNTYLRIFRYLKPKSSGGGSFKGI